MFSYLDNSATTPLCRQAVEQMTKALTEIWGNPSSLHSVGTAAHILLEDSRKTVSEKLGCLPGELIFTCGGTQSNNIAIFGAVNANKKRGKKVITSVVEHPSVAKAFDRLEKDGYEVVRIGTDKFGRIDLSELESQIDEKTILVSLMAVNNELGTIEPVDKVKAIIKKAGSPALLHVDAVQAFGKLDFTPQKLGADLVSISSHKIHGPKGAGALYVKNGVRIVSPVVGGGQEKDIRPGTEPMPAIAGFAAAAQQLNPKRSLNEITSLYSNFILRLKSIDGVVINSPSDALPYIANISLPGYPSEVVLNFLSDMGICVSSGSACSKGHKSPVLTAAGLDSALIASSVRVSLSRFTTKEELDYFIEGIEKIFKSVRKK